MKPTDVNTGLTYEELRDRLEYDYETGLFTWKYCEEKKWNSRVGQEAGSMRSDGYLSVTLDDRHYLLHRLAWLYAYGEWPIGRVDHIDTDRKNNRLRNLRLADDSQNKSNGKLYKNSTSGLKGVTRAGTRWKAQIVHKREVIYLGCYKTKEEAHEAYKEAAIRLQGEFARTS